MPFAICGLEIRSMIFLAKKTPIQGAAGWHQGDESRQHFEACFHMSACCPATFTFSFACANLLRCLRSEQTFKREICAPLGYLCQWQANAVRAFGKVASGSPAFHRLLTSLQTHDGLQRVLSCMQSSTPLHGKNSNDVGIQDRLFRNIPLSWLYAYVHIHLGSLS